MKKYLNALLTTALLSFVTVLAVNAQTNRDFRPDYDYYDDEFDWRWDVRVRISDGINSGLITRSEANRLYRKLENIEEKEYAYASDGFYDSWEQDDVWRDVQWLHERVGIELRDFDRTYYGFNRIGVAYHGYPTWWYNGGYNFYRFDKRGFGSIRVGYAPRYYVPLWVPNRTVYVTNYRTYGHTYYRTNERNRVVYNNTRVDDSRNNTTNVPRTNGRSNSTVYNRNSSINQTAPTTQSSQNRGETYERPASNSSVVTRSSSSDNNTRSRVETSRPATTERPAVVNRSYESRSESTNNARSTRSTTSTTPSRSSSSGNSVGTSAGRTKLPEARRSTSSSESRSATTTTSRRGN